MIKPYAIGIDFGGTNTKLGLMHRSGRLIVQTAFPTADCSQPAAFVKRISLEVIGLLKKARVQKSRVAGIGIGVPGLVDSERGIIHTLVNVPGWDGVHVAALIRKQVKLPCRAENDVNAMAVGEFRFGAARGYRNVVCITLGTGVGGGLILNGQLYRGATLTAGEIGHIVVQPEGFRCNCGNKGCLEALIGSKGLMRAAHGLHTTPLLLAKAAKRGDRVAIRVWNQAARYLGIVFAGITNLVNPDVFVIGGGISGVGGFFFDKVRETLRRHAMSVPARHVKVVRAGLGNKGGIMGAASIVFEKN